MDNTNIRAACDDQRRQCHSQGVAFGDLSRLVNRTREDQEESGTYARNQSGHNPQIRQELLDAEGNLRAQDIGISWQDGETFLHGVRITGQRDAREEDLRRPATAEAYPSCQRDREDAYRRPAMSTPYQQSREQPPRCIEMSDTPQPTSLYHVRTDGPAIDRQHPYSGLIAKTSGGRRGSSFQGSS